MADYEIFIETQSGERVGQLPFSTLDLTLRYNEPSRAKVLVPVSLVAFDFLDSAYRLLVRRDGVTLLSGGIASVMRAWNHNEDTLAIDLLDDLALLGTRLVVPVPSGPPYTSADYDVRTGAIETVMHQYVYYHAGAGAKIERRIGGLTQAADQGRGAVITARGRFISLLSMLHGLATLGGFGIRVSGLQFQVYQPVDKSADVKFSNEMGNLLQFSRTVKMPNGNYVYVGGGGEGTARVIVENGNSGSILRWGRIEAWKDYRSTSNTSELAQIATEYLTEQSVTESRVQFVGVGSLNQVGLGDVVSVAFGGQVYTETIREITVSISESGGEDVRISSGVDKPEMFHRLDKLEDNLMILEVR